MNRFPIVVLVGNKCLQVQKVVRKMFFLVNLLRISNKSSTFVR